MRLLHQIDWLAPWPEAGGDDLTFYRRMSAAYSQRLALAKAYIEQSEHRPGCMYPCTCGRDALLKAMTPDQPTVCVTCCGKGYVPRNNPLHPFVDKPCPDCTTTVKSTVACGTERKGATGAE